MVHLKELETSLTSRSNRQIDSGASVSSLDVSWGKWKSCFNHLRMGGKTDMEFHCKPSHTRCWRLPLCNRMAPRQKTRLDASVSFLQALTTTIWSKLGFAFRSVRAAKDTLQTNEHQDSRFHLQRVTNFSTAKHTKSIQELKAINHLSFWGDDSHSFSLFPYSVQQIINLENLFTPPKIFKELLKKHFFTL